MSEEVVNYSPLIAAEMMREINEDPLKCDRCMATFLLPEELETHGLTHENGFVDAPHGENPR